MKKLLWLVLYGLGVHRICRRLNRERLTIVLYHGVDDARDMGTYNYRGKFVRTDAFDRQLAYLKRHYSVLPLDEAVRALYDGTLPPYALAITFDDGYRNNYTHAFPLLRKHGLPATIFLTTDFVEKQQPLWVDRLEYAVNTGTCEPDLLRKLARDRAERERLKKLPNAERVRELEALEASCGARLTRCEGDAAVYAPLSFDDVCEMGGHGIMFGAHTRSHPILSTLRREEAATEIADSKRVLKDRKVACSDVFAYPNGQPGDMSDETATLVRDAGFAAAVTTIPGTNSASTDRYMLRRYTLDASEWHPYFALTISGARHTITSFIKRYAKRS